MNDSFPVCHDTVTDGGILILNTTLRFFNGNYQILTPITRRKFMTYDIPYMLFDYCYPSANKDIVRGTVFYDVYGGNVWDMPTKSDLSEMGERFRNQYAEVRRLLIYEYHRKHPFNTIFLAKKLNNEGVFMNDFSEIGVITGKIFYLLGEKYPGAQPTPIPDGIRCRVVVIDPHGSPSGCCWVTLPSFIYVGPENTGINILQKELKKNSPFHEVFPASDGDGDRWLIAPALDNFFIDVCHLRPDPEEYFYEFAFTALIQAANNPKYIHAVDISMVSVGDPSKKEGRIDLTGWDVCKSPAPKREKFHKYYKPINIQLEVEKYGQYNVILNGGELQRNAKQLCETIMSML